MAKQALNISINTDYVDGESVDTQVIRLVENALNMLDNDYQKVRILNYHIQKINDKRSADLEQGNDAQMQEVHNGAAR